LNQRKVAAEKAMRIAETSDDINALGELLMHQG
jgi:hypothetical protein